MTTDTIHSTQQSITRYISVFQQTLSVPFSPRLALPALDGYLVQQIATMYDLRPTIIDLTVEDTLGASAVLWVSAEERVKQYIAKLSHDQAMPDLARVLPELFDVLEMEASRFTPIEARTGEDFAAWWSMVQPHINEASPQFFMVAAEPADTLVERLAAIIAVHPAPVLFIHGIGLSGESAALEAVYKLCHQQPHFHLLLPRDGRAFWANSRLGIVALRSNAMLQSLLTRLAGLFSGNFDFVNLLESNMLLRQQYQKLLVDYEKIFTTEDVGPLPLVFDEAPLEETTNTAVAVRKWRNRLQKSVKRRLHLRTDGVEHADYHLEYLEVIIPNEMKVKQKYRGAAMLRNLSTQVWESAATNAHPVNVSYHWRDKSSVMVVKDGMRTALPFPVGRGSVVYVAFDIEAPAQPGAYIFEFDLVHEAVSWFSDEGQAPVRLPVHVPG